VLGCDVRGIAIRPLLITSRTLNAPSLSRNLSISAGAPVASMIVEVDPTSRRLAPNSSHRAVRSARATPPSADLDQRGLPVDGWRVRQIHHLQHLDFPIELLHHVFDIVPHRHDRQSQNARGYGAPDGQALDPMRAATEEAHDPVQNAGVIPSQYDDNPFHRSYSCDLLLLL
jgi:hypothetical protein